MISYGPRRIHICRGALIAPEYILTEAYCLHANDDDDSINLPIIEIRIGITNLNDIALRPSPPKSILHGVSPQKFGA